MNTLVYSLSVICALLPNPGQEPRRSEQKSALSSGTAQEVTVRIHNYAEAPPSLMGHVERVAGNILGAAGITTVWVDCPLGGEVAHDSRCDKPFSPLDFLVNVIPRSMSNRFHVSGGSLGLAMEGDGLGFGSVAFIFYDAVRDCAFQQTQDLDILLGTTIAHELGHLLLGANSHSTIGLMSAFWTRNHLLVLQQNGLVFSSADTVRVQQAMEARGRAARTSAVTSHSTVAPMSHEFPFR